MSFSSSHEFGHPDLTFHVIVQLAEGLAVAENDAIFSFLFDADGFVPRNMFRSKMKDERRNTPRLLNMTEEKADNFVKSMEFIPDATGSVTGRRYYLAGGRLLAESRLSANPDIESGYASKTSLKSPP